MWNVPGSAAPIQSDALLACDPIPPSPLLLQSDALLACEAAQLARLCDLAEPLVEVLLLLPHPPDSDVMAYWDKILQASVGGRGRCEEVWTLVEMLLLLPHPPDGVYLPVGTRYLPSPPSL